MHCTVELRGAPVITYSVAVPVGDKVYTFGGLADLEDQIDVYVFNTVSLRWRTLPPVTTTTGGLPPEIPCSRCGHTAVLIEVIVYLWGGWNTGLCNNMLYAFDVDAQRWIMTRVSGTVPEMRRDHSACVLGKVMYIHGGCFKANRKLNDTYKLDTTMMVWSLINTRGTLPPVSSRHSATIIGTKMFVFAGKGDEEVYNNLSVFDTETDCWLDIPSAKHLPEDRINHSAFAYNGELYMVGGDKRKLDALESCHDMWKLSPETFSWKEVEPKENYPFGVCQLCCCIVGSRVFNFGGFKNDFPPNNDPNGGLIIPFNDQLYILDLSPSLKTLCKLAVIQHGLEQSELPHDIRWELAAMTDGGLEEKHIPK